MTLITALLAALSAYFKSLEPAENSVSGHFDSKERHPGMYYKFMFPGQEG